MKAIYALLILLTINIAPLRSQGVTDILNASQSAAIFEACPGHTVNIDYQNYAFAVDYFLINHEDGDKVLVRLPGVTRNNVDNVSGGPGVLPGNVKTADITASVVAHPLGAGCTTECERIELVIPNYMQTTTIIFYALRPGNNSEALDTVVLNITNPNVTLGAFSPVTCSEDTIPLVASPSGGTFILDEIGPPVSNVATYPTPGGTNDYIQAIFPPYNATFTDALFIPFNAGSNLVLNEEVKDIRLTYSYEAPMTTTLAFCPAKLITQETELRNNSLRDIFFATVSDQSNSSPIQILTTDDGIFSSLIGTGVVNATYTGTHVTGTAFDGQAAGAGFHPITITIDNGGCTKSLTDSITVDNVPPSGVPTTLCRQDPPFDIFRDNVNFPWSTAWQGGGFFGIQYQQYNMVVSCTPAACLVPINTTAGSEHYQVDPSLAPGAATTITVTISYQRRYRSCLFSCGSAGSWSNVTVYNDVITLTDPPTPIIDTTLLPNYCSSATFVPLNSTPSGGTYTLYTLSGPNSGSSQILIGSFNPSVIHAGDPGDTRYRLVYEAGAGACTGRDSAEFDILAPIASSFIGDHSSGQGNGNNTYCVNEGLDILDATPTPVAYGHPDSITFSQGSYTGDGIIGYGPQFNPQAAGPGPHNIRFTFISQFGCKSTVDSTFYVNPKPTTSLVTANPNDEYCANDTIGFLIGSPAGGSYFGPTITNPQDSIFQPNLVYAPTVPNVPGYVNYTYIYTDTLTNCTDTTVSTVTINPLPNPQFTVDDYFCESSPPVLLTGTPPTGFFYIANGDTLLNDYYIPNPDYPTILYTTTEVDTIVYEVEELNCIERDTQVVRVVPNPVHYFEGVDGFGDTTDQACLGRDTLTLNSSLVFGTTEFFGSGVLFGSDQFVADVAGVGPHVITSYFTDTSNVNITCRDTFVDTFFVHSSPNVEFAVDGGCGGVDLVFEPNNDVLDLDRFFFGTTNLYDSITAAVWNFDDGTTQNATYTIGPIRNEIDDVLHLYANPGVYNASLFVENRGYCTDSDTVRVVVLSTTQPTADTAYTENFEGSDGNWIEESEFGNQSSNLWEHGLASGTRINTGADPFHNEVWITRADSAYAEESGWVYSPCFDLTQLVRPMLKLDYRSDMDPGNDGVVIEYYNTDENEWLPLGEVGDGIGWYNEEVIAGRPGLQDLAPIGWSGNLSGWREGRLKLDNFITYDQFRIRVAFGAVAVSSTAFEGFAFDNVFIGERTRNVLVEHFTNRGINNGNFNQVNQKVYDLIYNTYAVKDVVLAQLHTEDPLQDQFNDDNPNDPSARKSFYSLSGSGRAVVDGKTIGSQAPLSIDLDADDFEYDMLESPKFDINIDTTIKFGQSLQVRATITANEDMPIDNYYVYAMVTEDSMTYFSGEMVHSVVRDILPSASGRVYPQGFVTGDQIQVVESVNLPSTVNMQNVEVIVFIQKDKPLDKEVFQAVSSRDISVYDVTPGTEEAEQAFADAAEVNTMVLFPNPAQQYVNISFDQPLSKDYDWQVVDLRGVVLRNGTLRQGEQQLQIDQIDWASGMYLFVVHGEGFRTQRKLVITQP